MVQNKEKRAAKIGLLSALGCGLLVHLYGLVNAIHNYDDILQLPKGYGAGVTLGRWFLNVLGDFCEKYLDLGYNFPLVNGIALLVFVALSAALVIELLKIRNPISAGLAGCLIVTFPTFCSTMLFRFTAGYYGLCLLLSVLAAWAIEKPRYGIFLSALFTALSLGIYQAYTPVTIGLMVLMLLRQSLEEDAQFRALVRQGIRCAVALILGLLLYYFLLRLTLKAYGAELDSYLGINEMGKLSLSSLPYMLKKAWMQAVFFPLKNYCDLTTVRMLKLLWVAELVLTCGLAVFLLIRRNMQPLNRAFYCLMGFVLPIAVDFQVIMSPQTMYTLMAYSFVLLGCAPLMLAEFLDKPGKKPEAFRRILGLVLAGIVFYNGYYANYHYTALYYSNRQVENYFSGMVAQMRMTQGFTPEKTWAFLGDNQDPMLYDIWNTVDRYGGAKSSSARELMNVGYSFSVWFHNYLGVGTHFASQEEKNTLWQDARVTQMPCWPSQGSMQVIDDYLVVKFQEAP